ncbi:hypothetical protein LSAT2_014803 [Lamellibrachia satsuma]|nr:hypothetical protein LSAT2_014803 [Lamellibrachia satsuma]
MGDTSSPYWCDQVIYISFAAISILFSCIMVNWTAQLSRSHRWLVIQTSPDCDAKRRAIHTCYDAARFFDVELMKQEKMLDAFWFTVYELCMSWWVVPYGSQSLSW